MTAVVGDELHTHLITPKAARDQIFQQMPVHLTLMSRLPGLLCRESHEWSDVHICLIKDSQKNMKMVTIGFYKYHLNWNEDIMELKSTIQIIMKPTSLWVEYGRNW